MQSLSMVTEIDFAWPRIFWNTMSEQDQKNLIRCISLHCFLGVLMSADFLLIHTVT